LVRYSLAEGLLNLSCQISVTPPPFTARTREFESAMPKFVIVASVVFFMVPAGVLTMLIGPLPINRAGDFQEIMIGQRTFFIPKRWMTSDSVLAVDRNAAVTTPQPVRSKRRLFAYGRIPIGGLMGLINCHSRIEIEVLRSPPPPLGAQTKGWIAEAKSRERTGGLFTT
jgi:hypothetical protein